MDRTISSHTGPSPPSWAGKTSTTRRYFTRCSAPSSNSGVLSVTSNCFPSFDRSLHGLLARAYLRHEKSLQSLTRRKALNWALMLQLPSLGINSVADITLTLHPPCHLAGEVGIAPSALCVCVFHRPSSPSIHTARAARDGFLTGCCQLASGPWGLISRKDGASFPG